MKSVLGIIIFFISFSICAQNTNELESLKTQFNIKVGMLQSTLSGSDKSFLAVNEKMKSYYNYAIGIGVDNPIGNNWVLKHEVFFQNNGSKFKRKQIGEIYDSKLVMHSVRINPISIGYRTNQFIIFAGPYTNILTNASIVSLNNSGEKYKDHRIFGKKDDDQSRSLYLQNMDFGAVLGIEYQFKFGAVLGVQFSRGFVSIFDNAGYYENLEEPISTKDPKLYNQTLMIYAGWRI